MRHIKASTVIILEEHEREPIQAALSEVVRMLDEVASMMRDPADPDRGALLQHKETLRALLNTIRA